MFFSRLLPKFGLDLQTLESVKSGNKLAPLWGLFGSLFIFIGFTAYFAFIERIGVSGGLTSIFIGNTLAFGALGTACGSLISSWLGTRLNNYFWPMLLAVSIHLTCLYLLFDGFYYSEYRMIIIAYAIAWGLWIPFQMSSIAHVDISGRLVALVPASQALGAALGPFIASLLLSNNNYIPALFIALIFEFIGLLLFIPITLFVPIKNN